MQFSRVCTGKRLIVTAIQRAEKCNLGSRIIQLNVQMKLLKKLIS